MRTLGKTAGKFKTRWIEHGGKEGYVVDSGDYSVAVIFGDGDSDSRFEAESFVFDSFEDAQALADVLNRHTWVRSGE
jgi:hypothetical protein